MKGKNLRLKTALRAVVVVLMLGGVGITKESAIAQDSRANISFADATVKSLCVANWDTNGDGEISYDEAAAVQNLGTVFRAKAITSFNELQYFTGLTEIGYQAFLGCINMTSICIPNSVITIGYEAFLNCSGLTSVTIGNSVNSINNEAFHGCTGLSQIVVNGNNATYDSRNNCNAIIQTAYNSLVLGCKNTIIPNTVTSIGSFAFSGCSGLTSIVIPNSVTSMGPDAFSYCTGLTSISFSNLMHGIAENAFYGCRNLTSITIPSSITSIDDRAFGECYSISVIYVNRETPPSLGCSTFWGVNRSIPVNVPCGTTLSYKTYGTSHYVDECGYTDVWRSFTNFQEDGSCNIDFVDANVKSICVSHWDTNGDGDLSISEAEAVTDLGTSFGSPGISSFNELYYFKGLTSISEAAFCNSGLTSVIIPNSVTSIEERAFQGCNNLTSISIPSSVIEIKNYAFQNCTNLTSISITGNIRFIGTGAFDNTGWLNNQSNGILYLSNWCIGYKGTKPTGTLTISGGKTGIANNAFANCTGITSVSLPNSIKYINNAAFHGCSNMTSITMPNSVISIGHQAFFGCSNLGEINLGNSLTDIGQFAFYNCTSLSSIVIPNSVTTIYSCAFEDCSNLSSVTLSNSLLSIESYTFDNCSSLTSITIPTSVESIDDLAFNGCGSLAEIIVEEGNTVYDSRDNCNAIIETATNRLIRGGNNTIIPNSVIAIASSAFNNCSSLTSITVPNSVISIGSSAFKNCSGLTSAIIGNSVTNIGNNAFSDCTNMLSVTIGNSVTSIDYLAFNNCVNLQSINVLATTPPTLYNSYYLYVPFYNVPKTIPMYVPCGTLSAYKNATGWKEFTNYHEMVYVTISGYGNSTSSDHWTFIASPITSNVDPTTIDGLIATTSADYDLYRLNPAATNEWENWKQTGDHYHFNLVNGRGYLYANKNDVNIILKGDMFTGNYKDVTLQTGWNLVGNPYAQSAYVNRSYYKMNAAGDDVEAVSAYTTTAIPVCTGVVVQGASNSDVVRFTKTAPSKSTGNGGLQMTLAKAGNRGNEIQDKAIVIFEKNEQLGKYIFNENHAKLYIPQDGSDYAIAYSDGQHTIPLYFRTKEMGTYTINFNNDAELKNVYLVDKFEGAVIDLCVCSSYTFIGSSADRPDRFELVFGSPTESETNNFAYQSGNEIIVNGDGELQVFDVMGRMVAKQNINGVETIAKPSLDGVYIFRLNEKTQKIVVK